MDIRKLLKSRPVQLLRLVVPILALIWCIEQGRIWWFFIGMLLYVVMLYHKTYIEQIKVWHDLIVAEWNRK